MKNIYSLLFFAYLIQTIFSATEDKSVTIEKYNGPIECQDFGKYGIMYGFSIQAISEGYTTDTNFKFILGDPNYAYAECTIPASIEGQSQLIECYIPANNFPLFEQTKFRLPRIENLQIFDNTDDIYFENWEQLSEVEVDIGAYCYYNYNYMFTVGDNQPFEVFFLNDGTKEVRAFGSFSENQNDKLKSDDSDNSISVNLAAFVDSYYKVITCYIYQENSNGGEDEIRCVVDGKKKVVFFPTMGYDEEVLKGYVRLSMHREVSLVSSFIKLTGMIFLSLLLF